MEYFVIITVALLTRDGIRQCTFQTLITVQDGATREGIYEYVRSQLPSAYEDADVIFYLAEPNAA